jgi:SAM-dependent methyltransferase
MTVEEAVLHLRRDPAQAQLIEDGYLDADVQAAARRFLRSREFEAVTVLLGASLPGAAVLDLGAGAGIASYAFARAGAGRVYALEPDSSVEVGYGAMSRLGADTPLRPIAGVGEHIPLRTATIDIVYGRQVLHHARDLAALTAECARVLRNDGAFFATREHVAETESDLQAFLSQHPVHRLAGGENAFPLHAYCRAIRRAGFTRLRVLRPWETIINAFPEARSEEELDAFPRRAIERRLGRAARWVRLLPFSEKILWRHLRRPGPGALYSFLAYKY